MVQCEMCGTDVGDPNRVKIEGAELDVCDDCTEFGTEVRTEESSSSTSTKYSTSSSSGSSGGTGSSGSSDSSGGRSRDMFDEMDVIAQDYHELVREARESAGMSQSELAQQMNEKESLVRKLEHGDTLPTDGVQTKLEQTLDIDLSAGTSDADEEWESDTGGSGYTLGDVVKRKD